MKTLRISDETHRELMKIGSYEETMDDIIKKLLLHWKESTVKNNHVSYLDEIKQGSRADL